MELHQIQHIQREKVFRTLMQKIAEYPDALTILQNANLIDFDQVQTLLKSGQTGWAIANTLANNIKLNNELTDEYVIEFYGYSKIITGSNMNSLFETIAEKEKENFQFQQRDEFSLS